jgi:hypothetical protein
MSIFTDILEKLGLKKHPTAPTTGTTPGKPNTPATSAPSGPSTTSAPSTTPGQAPAAVKPISEVDVVKQLEDKARGSGLDWKVSIVDLLKLLGIDSSREARNELAKELGCPPELMKDSAKMNTWLHKEVLRKIAENGGNIPQSLLD